MTYLLAAIPALWGTAVITWFMHHQRAHDHAIRQEQPMTDRCIHQIELCPTCGGLQATTLHIGEGTVSLTFTDGTSHTSTSAQLYVGPAPEPCDREQQ